MEELSGGREGSIYKKEHTVVRPLNPWSDNVHRLLNHYQKQGISECPQFVAIKGQTEVLSFVNGDTYNYPLTGPIASESALISAANLLRKLHDASVSFLAENNDEELTWMLPVRAPQEVMCHGDYSPYNVALNGDVVVGVFDFDTAHPAPRVWDLAYAVYCWAPFKTDEIDALGSLYDQIDRAKQFCDAYSATEQQRTELVDVMVARLDALVTFMRDEAESGNEQFAANLEDGHHLSYLADIEYLKANKAQISRRLME
ncbi:aminoglycoside phosphotransferase family protein [Enterovibrio makurazakiensis]|uniref:Aminoglycoside phosphotransferase family protein n=1 Tax=Enterovibrio gelatinilyticus TaxID=2899819 RepID=A0ABT5QYX8_9GAMM|nr:aminoglycoside phosphotransferase family protein [Enterovibrio sp. ZSDZ42]MDD1793223.1 aminoglycoside phosphotransferase family protein [Enterovibrio sp. ZSDZ42]